MPERRSMPEVTDETRIDELKLPYEFEAKTVYGTPVRVRIFKARPDERSSDAEFRISCHYIELFSGVDGHETIADMKQAIIKARP